MEAHSEREKLGEQQGKKIGILKTAKNLLLERVLMVLIMIVARLSK